MSALYLPSLGAEALVECFATALRDASWGYSRKPPPEDAKQRVLLVRAELLRRLHSAPAGTEEV